ncbi:MAG: Flp family type IVb pilin [Tepidiformaceae bacterium]
MSKLQTWAVTKVVALKNREEGQGLAEYGMILALIAVVGIGFGTTLGTDIESAFGDMSGAF